MTRGRTGKGMRHEGSLLPLSSCKQQAGAEGNGRGVSGEVGRSQFVKSLYTERVLSKEMVYFLKDVV